MRHAVLRSVAYAAFVSSAAVPACRSAGSPRASPSAGSSAVALAPASSAPAPVASAAPRAPSAFDPLFREWEKKLPAPATLSEGNGATMQCPTHGWATYTLLEATAKKVPIASDADLVGLVLWIRHSDACIRQIALEAAIAKIGFDSNRLAVPNMHEVDHYQYHELLLALKTYLDAKRVAYSSDVFAGLMLSVEESDFGALMQGKWEEANVEHRNFQLFVEVDGKSLRVTNHETHGDPDWPDHTMISQIKQTPVNAKRQFVVTGDWRMESTVGRPPGKKISPSDITYTFWPVSRDIVWFDAGRSGNWEMLVRAKK